MTVTDTLTVFSHRCEEEDNIEDVNRVLVMLAAYEWDQRLLDELVPHLREHRTSAGKAAAMEESEIVRAVNQVSKETYTEGEKFTEMLEAVRKQEGGVPDLPTEVDDKEKQLFESSPTILAKEALVRNKDGTINVCIITPGWGNSGYYSEDLLKDSVPVFTEGLHMYWDHPTMSEEFQRPERSLRDLAGALATNAEWKGTGFNGPGIYATAKVRSPYNEELEDLAEHIGVSVVIFAMSHRGEIDGTTGDIMDKIVAARSVDFVTLPGRGGKIEAKFESLRETDKGNENREEEDLVTEEERKKLEAERDQLKARNAELEKENGELKEDNDRKTEAVNVNRANELALKKLAKVEGMPEVTQVRLAKKVSTNPPLKSDGSLDTDKVEEAAMSAAKEEAEYLESIGFGESTDLGPSSSNNGNSEDSKKRLEASWAKLGLKDDKLKTATEGR